MAEESCRPLLSGGYDDNIFVDPPSEALGFHCPICLLVLKEPHLLSCCGRHVCEVCIQGILDSDSFCPYCRTKGFNTLLNKEKKGKVLALRVYCFNSSNGCDWTGELGDAKRHLETKCGYVEEDCPNGCGERYLRHAMPLHQREECIKQPIEAKVESQLSKVTERLDSLNAKYEEKISKLELKLKEQERIIIALQESLEEEKESFLKEKAQLEEPLDKTVAMNRLDIQSIVKQLKEVKSQVTSCEATLPVVSTGAIDYLTSTASWRSLVKEVERSGMTLTINKTWSPPVVQLKEVSKKEFKDAESRVGKLVSSVNERVVHVPNKGSEALKYLFRTSNGNSVIEELKERLNIGCEVGELSDSGGSVIIYGMTMFSTYSAAETIQGFTENQFVEKRISVPEIDETRQSTIKTFASSKNVQITFNSRFHVVLRGGQYDTQLVEDELMSASSATQPVVPSTDCVVM